MVYTTRGCLAGFGTKCSRQARIAQRKDVGRVTQCVNDTPRGGGKDLRIVDLTEGHVNGPRESFRVEGELCVNTVLVAARVLAMPGSVEIDRDKSVENVAVAVHQTLIAETGGDAFCSKQCRQQV